MSRFTPITVQETVDPNVTAKKKTSTRTGYSQSQSSKVDSKDTGDALALQRVLQSMADDINLLGRVVSSMPFYGGVYIAKLDMNSTTPVVVKHGIDGYVDVMLTVASRSTDGVASFDITEQSPTNRTVTIRSNRDCVVAALIYPQKRGT